MRFVHLAPRACIAAIRSDGLHPRAGWSGSGVYALPLFRRGDAPGADDLDAWRALLRDGSGERAAVVFRIPARCWPLDVDLELCAAGGARFLDEARAALGDALAAAPARPDAPWSRLVAAARHLRPPGAVRSGAADPPLDLLLRVRDERALAALLDLYAAARAATPWTGSDPVEVIVRATVPAWAIERVYGASARRPGARRGG